MEKKGSANKSKKTGNLQMMQQGLLYLELYLTGILEEISNIITKSRSIQGQRPCALMWWNKQCKVIISFMKLLNKRTSRTKNKKKEMHCTVLCFYFDLVCPYLSWLHCVDIVSMVN